MRHVLKAALVSVTLVAAAGEAAAQGYFGQNQVQYERFNWRVLETEHFQVHFYQGLETTARIAGSSPRVSDPRPGPTSRTTSSGPTPAVRTMRRTVPLSTTPGPSSR